ncbi:FHA domain-containing protein [bacterium]|nr:FHA domain-containing protein [bacterium]
MIDEHILNILVCPRCKGELMLVEGAKGLLCEKCQLKYPIKGDIPIMLTEEAINIQQTSIPPIIEPSLSTQKPHVRFSVISGPDKDRTMKLEIGTCTAIGRAEDAIEKTAMFNVDVGLALDESTKGLIQQYISKQFRKSSEKGDSGLGGFKRTNDFLLKDDGVSKLHSMSFYDEAGVGILDLVSKNGTFINGKEIESHLLQKNDVIELGETKIVFESSEV